MSGNKDWMNAHFKGAPSPAKPMAPLPVKHSGIGGIVVTLLVLIVVGAGGVLTADYFGYLHLGIFVAKTDGALPDFSREERTPERTAAMAAPPSSYPTEAAAIIIPLPNDPARASQLQARMAQLDRGLDLMGRDFKEVDRQAAACRWELKVRVSMSRPYSAAERVYLTEEYAKNNPNLTAIARNNLVHEHDAAVADVKNATRRLQELTEKGQSLKDRITKAATDREPIATELGVP